MVDRSPHVLNNSYEAILAAAPDCIKILSADGILRFVNANGLELMEAGDGQTLNGARYADFWPEDMRQAVQDAIRGAVNGEKTRVEGYCPTLKGSPRWWETKFQRVSDSGALNTEVIGITRDVSYRRNRELLWRLNEQRFAALLDAVGEGICETSRDGRCTFVNAAGASMLGYRPDELVGSKLHETIHHHRADGSLFDEAESPIFKAVQTGISVQVTDEVFWHKDGHAIPIRYSVHAITDSYSETRAVLTFTDGTEHKRMQDTDRRTTEFIAVLAHELRNPLAPIRTGLQLMRKAGDNAAGIGPVREMMERQVGQMVHLIGDLLDIARVTSGKMELKRDRVELRRVIDAALEASAPLIANANHSLHVDVPLEPLYVDGDATRLAQIFTNLLNNAAKYTAAGGRIEVTVRRADTDVVIDVADSGIGIARHALQAIFEMFTRVGRDGNGQQGGLGIGLNLVRRLVELHGGSVVASSAGVGQGSHFLVKLPLASPPVNSQSTDPVKEAVPQREPSRIRVLLVDDNVDAAVSLSLLLELGEHTTQVANSGADALKVVGDFKPDIVFLDIGMPGMNGYEVARALRKMPEAGNPVLVALTGWGGESDRLKSKNAGFDEHLTKPADISSIEKLLARLAGH